jgi:hypothetical protein
MEEAEPLLLSESFPLDEKKERKRMKPIAECHKLLKGVKIDTSQIIYKPLGPEHLDEVKKLHQEWFPIKYEDQFYNDTLVTNRGQFFSVGAFYYLKISESETKEIILGLAICNWRYVDEYFFKETNENLIKEISDNLNYEEEAKLFLSPEKFYYSVYILSLGVIDECRKMSIGTNIMKTILNYSISFYSCIGVYLSVISTNHSGKKFYEKNGFICANTFKGYYLIEDKRYDGDFYVKIFTRKEKDLKNKSIDSFLTFKEKLVKNCIYKPFYLLVKLFMLIFLCQCFRKKIRMK